MFRNEIAGFIFVSVFGTIGHFVFEWLDSNPIVGLFFPINESVWEHLKLLFFPYMIWSFIEYFIGEKQPGYFSSKIKSVLWGMLFLVAFFYTYSGATGKVNNIIDIISFFLAVALSFIISYISLKNNSTGSRTGEIISICLFAVISVLFFIFTFSPPLIPLFEDPQNFTFGI